jgi:hypothetical protein
MTSDKSVTAVCLESSGQTVRLVDLLSRATASNSCRQNIELSTLSQRKVAERQSILSFFQKCNQNTIAMNYFEYLHFSGFSFACKGYNIYGFIGQKILYQMVPRIYWKMP